MNINQLRQQRADALTKAKALNDTAENEKRAFSESEAAEYDAALASVEATDANIKRAEKLIEATRNAPHVEVDVPNAAKKPWSNFGEQLIAVANSKISGRIDPRLLALGPQGANETVDAEGGFLVQPEYTQKILQNTWEVGQVSNRVTKIPMSTNRLVMNAVDERSRANGQRWGGIQVYWTGEGMPYTPTKPKFREIQLTANKLTGLIYVTEELLADGPAINSFIDQAFPDEFAYKIDDSIINGTGAGMPLGFLYSNAAVVIAPESGQSSATLITANVLKMWARFPARGRKTAVWLINQDIDAQLFAMTLGSGTAVQLLYTPPGVNGNDSDYGILLGCPVIPVEQAATLGTQGDIMLVDPSQYLLGQRGDLRADSSMHVAFVTGEMAFRFMLRLDGQPMWNAPIIPANGTNAQSPFVVLANRP